MKKSLFVGCLVVLMAGCGEKPVSKSVNADSPSKAEQLSKQSTKSSPVTQNNIELLNAGAEPRKQLRLAPPANTKQTLQMTMKMDMAMSVPGQPQRTLNSPPIKMTINAEVTKVDSNGDIYANVSYSDADIVANANTPPNVVNAMRSQLKKLVGLRGSMVIDNQGNTKQASFNVPEELDPNTKQVVQQMMNSFKQLSSPVPTEAVGVGAKWRVPNAIAVNGMNLNQTATYELVNLQDNVATLQANIEQQAKSQKMNPPGLPAGASIDLKSLNSQGNGKVTMALNKIMPTSSTMSMRSNTQMNVKEPSTEKAMAMDMKVSVDVTMESK